MSNELDPTCPPGWTFNKQLCRCDKITVPPLPTSNNYKFSYKFGSKGTGDGQFIDPHDTTFDSDDNAYIPDRERNDIQVFTHDGKFIRKFGGPGSGPGQFNVPYSCQIGPGDTVWICDRENSRVQKLSKDGTFIQEWKEMNGKKLNMPEDLAFDVSKQFLYFTDTGNNRIIKCTADMQFVLEWGSAGTGDSQFDHPHGIDVGPDGNVYVNSGFQPYIKKFTPDGKFIKKWGSEGTGEGQFLMFLEHLDVDDATGRVFIINNNVRPYVFIFDSEGVYLGKFGSEKEGSKDGEFKEPEHVTIDSKGRAFCVDSGNFRVQVFEAEGATPPPPPPGNRPPIANAGVDQTVTPNTIVTLNGSQSYDPDPDGGVLTFVWKEVDRSTVTLSNPNAINPTFTAPAADTTLAFELIITDAKGGIGTDVVSIIVKSGIVPPPPPPPPPPTGDVLWDSNIHLKTGQKYTITDTYGDQKPDGKGVFMAASGNPRVHVDADGVFHLEADAGHGRVYIKARNYNAKMTGELMFEDDAIRNTTLRLRSRHNEGGACENRFGGFGVTVERAEQLAETSTERCHNEHSNTVKNPLEKHIEVGQWIKFEYSCWSNADKSAINQKLQYDYGDGQFKTVIEESFTTVEPHMMDEASFNKESYAWLRVNNESTGKVAYRNIKIIKL